MRLLYFRKSDQWKAVLGATKKNIYQKGSVGTVAEHKSQPAGLIPLPCEVCLFIFAMDLKGPQWELRAHWRIETITHGNLDFLHSDLPYWNLQETLFR